MMLRRFGRRERASLVGCLSWRLGMWIVWMRRGQRSLVGYELVDRVQAGECGHVESNHRSKDSDVGDGAGVAATPGDA